MSDHVREATSWTPGPGDHLVALRFHGGPVAGKGRIDWNPLPRQAIWTHDRKLLGHYVARSLPGPFGVMDTDADYDWEPA
jgi:hypothetical protein